MHVRAIAHWFVTSSQLVMHDTQPLLSYLSDLSIQNIVVYHNGGVDPSSRPTGFRFSKPSRSKPSYYTNGEPHYIDSERSHFTHLSAKYHILESGLSQYQPPEDMIPEAEPYIVYSGHRDVPEYQKGLRENPETSAVWYNPFQLDVFMVGNMFRQEILSVRSHISSLLSSCLTD